jgi:hypothetical protein
VNLHLGSPWHEVHDHWPNEEERVCDPGQPRLVEENVSKRKTRSFRMGETDVPNVVGVGHTDEGFDYLSTVESTAGPGGNLAK